MKGIMVTNALKGVVKEWELRGERNNYKTDLAQKKLALNGRR